ncbi:MAG: recombinase RecT [Akkermansia sp.]
MSAELATNKKIKTVIDLLSSQRAKSGLQSLALKTVTPERIAGAAIHCLQKSPALLQCSQDSLVTAIKTLALMGCEADGIHGFLVPFSTKNNGMQCTPIPTARGLMRTARAAGVKGILFDSVTSQDIDEGRFVWAVKDGELRMCHSPNPFAAKDDVIGYYCVWKGKQGETQGVLMSKDDVDKIRERSKTPNKGPWFTDYEQMAFKTIIKRAAKQWDLPTEVHEAMADADEREFGEMRNVTPEKRKTPPALFEPAAVPEPKHEPAPATTPEPEERVVYDEVPDMFGADDFDAPTPNYFQD